MVAPVHFCVFTALSYARNDTAAGTVHAAIDSRTNQTETSHEATSPAPRPTRPASRLDAKHRYFSRHGRGWWFELAPAGLSVRVPMAASEPHYNPSYAWAIGASYLWRDIGRRRRVTLSTGMRFHHVVYNAVFPNDYAGYWLEPGVRFGHQISARSITRAGGSSGPAFMYGYFGHEITLVAYPGWTRNHGFILPDLALLGFDFGTGAMFNITSGFVLGVETGFNWFFVNDIEDRDYQDLGPVTHLLSWDTRLAMGWLF